MTLFIVLICLAVLASAISCRRDGARTKQALRKGAGSMVRLAPMLAGVTALVGLTLALVPPDVMASLLSGHGVTSFFLVAGVGSVAAIPAPVAFPLAGSLMGLGAGAGAVATFITTLTMVSVVSMPMEAAYFGWRFTAARQGASFILALAVGALMGVVL